jgi:hypothetical protein
VHDIQNISTVIPVASGLDILFAMQTSTSTEISADSCEKQKLALFQKKLY